MAGPRISVIVPVYKAEAFLRDCAVSVLAQQGPELELLLVDDGSPDASGKLCDELAAGDARVRVFHKPNGGPSSARNLALKEARGELLFFLDADDLLPDGSLACLAAELDRTGADMAVGAFSKFTGQAAPQRVLPLPGPALFHEKETAEYALSYLRAPNRNQLFAYVWGRLFRADLVRRGGIVFDEKLRTFEDVAFNFEYLMLSGRVAYVPEVVCEHRMYEDYTSATMTISAGAESMLGYQPALRVIASYLEKYAPPGEVGRWAGHANVSLTIIQLVRICGQLTDGNSAAVSRLIAAILDDARLRADLGSYSPSGSDSRLLPWLMRLRLVRPLMLVCRWKARRRYGKGGRK